VRRPKDGPSAGRGDDARPWFSLFTGKPIRSDVAMTGEISLRRAGDADRRAEGEVARGPSRRHQDGHGAQEERKRPRRHPCRRQVEARVSCFLEKIDDAIKTAIAYKKGGSEQKCQVSRWTLPALIETYGLLGRTRRPRFSKGESVPAPRRLRRAPAATSNLPTVVGVAIVGSFVGDQFFFFLRPLPRARSSSNRYPRLAARVAYCPGKSSPRYPHAR